MRIVVTIISFAALFFACNAPSAKTETITVEANPQTSIDYPEELQKVFSHHGGLDLWNEMNALSYEIVKDQGNEKQIIDLKSRSERIEAHNFTSGFDGEKYWLMADSTYKGNVKFYTNLIFYFYAMPFVLADPGINYEQIVDLEFEDKKYPGYRISYGDGVGISPEDEYFIHYDPNTFEMAWLGYTVTFHTGEQSKKVKWIRYNDWGQFKGLKLPNSLTWYKVEEGQLTEPAKTRTFTEVNISKDAMPQATFVVPYGAKVVE